MNMQQWAKKNFILALILSVLISGCQQASPPAPTPTPTRTLIPTPVPTATQTPPATSTAPVPVNFLVDVENAVIQVEGQGKFFSPKFAELTSNPGRGSGFIIDPSGIAITTNHAVVGAEQIHVWVGSDRSRSYNAKVVAVSECPDLAIIDIEGGPFDFLGWSDSPVQSGQKVYVAGYPLAKPTFIQTSGLVADLTTGDRPNIGLADLLFAYNVKTEPGMSGGPIVSPEGKILGVHIAENSTRDKGFGISSETLRESMGELFTGQNVDSLGVNGEPTRSADGALSGIWVYTTQPGSLASQIGIEGNDLITSIGGEYLIGDQILNQYCQALQNWDTQKPLDIQVYRASTGALMGGQLNGKKLTVVEDQYAGTLLTPEVGTPVLPNMKADKPGDTYYKEEFNEPLASWKRFVLQGDEQKVNEEIKDGKLLLTIDAIFTYVYYIFNPLKVTDVRLDIKAENLGRNNNNVTLICRYSVERGWYEFNIANNGLYWVKRYDPRFGTFVDIGKGASKLINMGQGINEYGAVCKDNKLTLFINGKEVRSFTDNTLVTGQVGFSVSSFSVTPVTVAVDYFTITVP
jgi:S1-C subfamily serine protease